MFVCHMEELNLYSVFIRALFHYQIVKKFEKVYYDVPSITLFSIRNIVTVLSLCIYIQTLAKTNSLLYK